MLFANPTFTNNLDSSSYEAVTFEVIELFKGENKFTGYLAYDLQKVTHQSFELVAYGDGTLLKKSSKLLSDTIPFIFHEPFGKIALLIDGKKVRDTPVRTDVSGWTSRVESIKSGKKFSPWVDEAKIVTNGTMKYPTEHIPKSLRQYYFTAYVNNNTLQVDQRSLSYLVKFRLLEKPQYADCNHINFILASDQNMILKTTIELEGCEFYAGTKYGQSPLNIKSKTLAQNKVRPNLKELSALIFHEERLREWNLLHIKAENKTVKYSMNDQEIYQMPFQPNRENFTDRLVIHTKGIWEIDYIKITDGQGLFYEDDINR